MLEKVKECLGITGNYQDDIIQGWIDEIKQLMIDGGIAPSIVNDEKINWICSKKHTNRALRGLTSAGTKGRGLTSKGKGSEQARRRK